MSRMSAGTFRKLLIDLDAPLKKYGCNGVQCRPWTCYGSRCTPTKVNSLSLIRYEVVSLHPLPLLVHSRSTVHNPIWKMVVESRGTLLRNLLEHALEAATHGSVGAMNAAAEATSSPLRGRLFSEEWVGSCKPLHLSSSGKYAEANLDGRLAFQTKRIVRKGPGKARVRIKTDVCITCWRGMRHWVTTSHAAAIPTPFWSRTRIAQVTQGYLSAPA